MERMDDKCHVRYNFHHLTFISTLELPLSSMVSSPFRRTELHRKLDEKIPLAQHERFLLTPALSPRGKPTRAFLLLRKHWRGCILAQTFFPHVWSGGVPPSAGQQCWCENDPGFRPHLDWGARNGLYTPGGSLALAFLILGWLAPGHPPCWDQDTVLEVRYRERLREVSKPGWLLDCDVDWCPGIRPGHCGGFGGCPGGRAPLDAARRPLCWSLCIPLSIPLRPGGSRSLPRGP